MQTARDNRLKRILDEVGRGSNLKEALALVADQIIADTGAPTCKIWVVKRGDMCERCPLAGACTNRQMCMHLTAAGGTDIEREYPRIPLSVFNASLIARGGVADFSDPNGAGDKLFGLQRNRQDHGLDSFAVYPLRGISGTVGLIGIFNHRPFRDDELQALQESAPAAVTAIRVAELQSRCDSLRTRLERETAAASELQQSAARREGELEEAVAQLTHVVAQLQVERESLVRAKEQVEQDHHHLEEQHRHLRERADLFAEAQEQSSHMTEAMAAQVEAERLRFQEENDRLKTQLAAMEASVGDLDRLRARLNDEMDERQREFEIVRNELEAMESELSAARARIGETEEALPRLEARALALMDENSSLFERNTTLEASLAQLRDENSIIVDSVNELERSLRIAEDARARLEQSRIGFEERIAELSNEIERLRVENGRVAGENEQLVTETDRLRAEVSEMEAGGIRAGESNQRLAALNAELTQAQALAEARLLELERQNEALGRQLNEERESSRERTVELENQIAELAAKSSDRSGETEGLQARAAELEAELEAARSRALEMEHDNAALAEANARMEGAIKQFEQLSARLEDSAERLRARAESNERARSENEQRARVLAEQNRMLSADAQSKARFLAIMSHELRTPMNAIIGFTSLLLDDRSLQLTERHRRNLERVSRNGRELLELINNVLDLSKIEAGRMDVYSEPADARDLIERALGVVDPLREGRAVELIMEVGDDLPRMRTDRAKLQQILINLLSNAIKFTSQGEVRVAAESAGEDRVRISVADTGVGISEPDIPKIFEEFRQVGAGRGSRTGTGLGLAITRRLVGLLGGEISVASRVGEGSVFTVTLPVEIEGRVAPSELETPLSDPDRTALVIDSDPASLFLTKKYLSEAGYSVATTDDTARGVEIARKAMPAVVTLDLDLLEDGFGILKQLAAERAGKRKSRVVIAISSDEGIAQQVIDEGATFFLRKPIEKDELIRSVERASADARARVLVVDDDQDALDLVVAMLEGGSYEVHTAASGREAMDALARGKPDVLVLDLMLPEMDGFEIVHRLSLNQEWRAIPVILLTARDLSHEERRALDIGAARIIQKGSFSRDELLAEVAVLLDGEPVAKV